MKTNSHSLAALGRLGILGALLGIAPTAHAAVRTWDGGGTNDNWTTVTNWVGDLAPVAGDDLVFPPGAARLSNVNDFPAGTSFNSITFTGSGYTLDGSSLVLAAGVSASHTSGGNQVGLSIQLSANQTFTNSAGGSLSFVLRTIDLNGHDLTFGVGGGDIGSTLHTIVGAGAVIKTGAGNLYFGNGGSTNSYTGVTEVRQGRLYALSGFALGTTNGNTTVFAGATLDAGGTFTVPEPLVLHGSVRIGAVNFGTNLWTGPVALMTNNVGIEVVFNTRANFNGVMSGSGGFTRTGFGTLVLAGTNTYTGTTTNADGILVVNGLQPQAPLVLTSGLLAGTGTVGTVTSIGSSAKTITPGGSSPGMLTTSNLTLNATTTFSVRLNGTTAGTSYDQLKVNGSVTLSNANLAFSLGYVPAPGDTFILINNDGADAVTNTFNGLPEGTVMTSGTNQLQISYTGGSGNDVVVRIPLTPIRLTRTWSGAAANTFWANGSNWVGQFAPTPGDDLVFPPGAQNLSTSNNFPAGTTFNSILVGVENYSMDGSNITLNAGLTFTNAFNSAYFRLPIQLASNQTFTITGTNVQNSLQGAIDTAGKDLTLAGPGAWQVLNPITGAGSLIKTGVGRANLYASNSFAGAVQILQGALFIYNDNALGATNVSTTVATGATLGLANPSTVPEPLLLGGTLLAGIVVPRTWSGPITLTAPDATVQADGALTINGLISGSGGLTLTGSNVLTLNANNNYSGTTTLSNGTLKVNGSQPGSAVALVGGTLAGAGTVGTITASGSSAKTLAPGGSPATFTCSNVTLNASTTLAVELNGAAPGSGYDQLNVNGTVALGNATLSVTRAFTPALGASFLIINNDGSDAVTGTFGGLTSGGVVNASNVALQISYTGGSGNDVVLTRISPPTRFESVTPLTNGQLRLQATGGLVGFSYTIQAATNLNPGVQWSNLGSALANSGGVVSFTDTNAPLFPVRFYRALSP